MGLVVEVVFELGFELGVRFDLSGARHDNLDSETILDRLSARVVVKVPVRFMISRILAPLFNWIGACVWVSVRVRVKVRGRIMCRSSVRVMSRAEVRFRVTRAEV